MKNKQKEKPYIECERCDKNNWDNPKFDGCPRGGGMDCEVEIKGTITKELKIKK